MANFTRPCDTCGEIYSPTYWGEKRKSRTCGKACMALLNRAESTARQSNARAESRSSTACHQCGSAFIAGRSDARYCSKECRLAVRRNAWPAKQYEKQCEECGGAYTCRNAISTLCSQRCRRRKYERLNPGAKRISDAKREGIISSGWISERDWTRLIRRHDSRCAYCDTRAPLTMDHIIPLHRGGLHTIGNVLPACSPCNSRKQASLLVEWRARQNNRG